MNNITYQPILDQLGNYHGLSPEALYKDIRRNNPTLLDMIINSHRSNGNRAFLEQAIDGLVKESTRRFEVRMDAPERPFELTEEGQRKHQEYLKFLDGKHQEQLSSFWQRGVDSDDVNYKDVKEKYLEAHKRTVRDWLGSAQAYYQDNDVPVPDYISSVSTDYSKY